MADDKDLGKELLKRNGIEPGELPENRRRELRRMTERDRKHMGRIMMLTIGAWTVLAFSSTFTVLLQSFQGPHILVFRRLVPYVVLFWLAVLVTVYWTTRSRSVTQREIQANLADIAEQLRQLVEDQRADRAKRTGAPGPEPESETKRD